MVFFVFMENGTQAPEQQVRCKRAAWQRTELNFPKSCTRWSGRRASRLMEMHRDSRRERATGRGRKTGEMKRQLAGARGVSCRHRNLKETRKWGLTKLDGLVKCPTATSSLSCVAVHFHVMLLSCLEHACHMCCFTSPSHSGLFVSPAFFFAFLM